MEARDKMLDRAKANLRKAAEVRVSVHPNAKPNTQSWPGSTGGGVAGNFARLTRGDLQVSVVVDCGRWGGFENDPLMDQEKSDRPILGCEAG